MYYVGKDRDYSSAGDGHMYHSAASLNDFKTSIEQLTEPRPQSCLIMTEGLYKLLG